MPDPGTLRAYEEVLPGAAERILQMAEVAAKGQHEIHLRLADEEISGSKQGRWMAYSIAVAAVLAAIAFFATGIEVGGGFMLSLPVVLLIQSFWSGRSS
jgi:uncharacterized membrane protein